MIESFLPMRSDVARDAKTRDAIRTVRAQDFSRLTQDDFLVIVKRWLKHKHVQPPKRVPRPYQRKAIERILKTFRSADRATAVMACGTGKTLVALWVAEADACSARDCLCPFSGPTEPDAQGVVTVDKLGKQLPIPLCVLRSDGFTRDRRTTARPDRY